MKARQTSGFTLLELLVVIGLISVLTFFLASGLTGSSKAAALQAAQATLSNLVTAARTRAIASGKTTRLLINDNPANPTAFHRRVVLAEQTVNLDGTVKWTALQGITLPDGVYLLSRDTHVITGIFPNIADWKTADGSKTLGSSCLDTTWLSFAYESTTTENWEFVGFTARGTMETNAGALVLANGRVLPPVQVVAGSSPAEMTDPRNVRGMQVSLYGVPRLINDRTGF